VAALPFTNMSGDPEQEVFSDGIAEDIITAFIALSLAVRHRAQLLLHLQGPRGGCEWVVVISFLFAVITGVVG
jgi:hypothetical protein